MPFAIQGLKMAKTKELSREMWDRIIERHKGGQGYRKISKEMNLEYEKGFAKISEINEEIFKIRRRKSEVPDSKG